MKRLVVNGSETTVNCRTLDELITHYKLNKAHVVAEVDGVIVERSQWETWELSDGAQVELVHFVGGG